MLRGLYGRVFVHFVLSPLVGSSAERTDISVRGEPARVATIAQAIVDELRFRPFGLDYAAVTAIVRTAFELQRTTGPRLGENFPPLVLSAATFQACLERASV